MSYTVNYLEKNTDTVLQQAKTVGNQTYGTAILSRDEIIDIPGYTYASTDKAVLVIGADNNIINIYYTKRTDLSYQVNYLEKGSNKELQTSKVVTGQTYGTTINTASEVIEIEGYDYNLSLIHI